MLRAALRRRQRPSRRRTGVLPPPFPDSFSRSLQCRGARWVVVKVWYFFAHFNVLKYLSCHFGPPYFLNKIISIQEFIHPLVAFFLHYAHLCYPYLTPPPGMLAFLRSGPRRRVRKLFPFQEIRQDMRRPLGASTGGGLCASGSVTEHTMSVLAQRKDVVRCWFRFFFAPSEELSGGVMFFCSEVFFICSRTAFISSIYRNHYRPLPRTEHFSMRKVSIFSTNCRIFGRKLSTCNYV